MRPFLVIALVLAALAALVFGVLSFLKEPAAAPAPNAPVTAPESPGAKTTQQLEKQPAAQNDRMQPVKGAEDRQTPSESVAGWVYENELAGTVLSPQSQPLANCEVKLSTAYELVF